jgi:hypothetical protein
MHHYIYLLDENYCDNERDFMFRFDYYKFIKRN